MGSQKTEQLSTLTGMYTHTHTSVHVSGEICTSSVHCIRANFLPVLELGKMLPKWVKGRDMESLYCFWSMHGIYNHLKIKTFFFDSSVTLGGKYSYIRIKILQHIQTTTTTRRLNGLISPILQEETTGNMVKVAKEILHLWSNGWLSSIAIDGAFLSLFTYEEIEPQKYNLSKLYL